MPRGAHRVPRCSGDMKVHVVIDRPLGSVHPSHPNIVYEVNYGYVPGITGGDGEEQDAYVLGPDSPLKEFDGVLIAVIRRENDTEDKWVVAPEGRCFTDREIMEKTAFQEKYFKVKILR